MSLNPIPLNVHFDINFSIYVKVCRMVCFSYFFEIKSCISLPSVNKVIIHCKMTFPISVEESLTCPDRR
jgi:hypothetical protein